jgi:hypothetical protein
VDEQHQAVGGAGLQHRSEEGRVVEGEALTVRKELADPPAAEPDDPLDLGHGGRPRAGLDAAEGDETPGEGPRRLEDAVVLLGAEPLVGPAEAQRPGQIDPGRVHRAHQAAGGGEAARAGRIEVAEPGIALGVAVPALEHLIREDVGVGVDYRRLGVCMSRRPTMIQTFSDLSSIPDDDLGRGRVGGIIPEGS